MKRLMILMLILFVSISSVSASDNFTDSVMESTNDDIFCDDGDISTIISDSNETTDVDDNSTGGNSTSGNVTEGNFNDDNSTSGNVTEGNFNDDNSTSGNVTEGNSTEGNSTQNITIQADDYACYYNANPVYTFKLLDSNGKGVSVDDVTVILNSIAYSISTDENGKGKLPIRLGAGDYQIFIEYGNASVTRNITLYSYKITSSGDIKVKYGTWAKYTIKVLDNDGNPISGANVKFTVGDRVYNNRTDAKGYAALYLNYDSGKYMISYSLDDMRGQNKYTVTNKITMKILYWGLKGDVTKAPLIKKYMPNNYWVKQAVAATKKGIPLLTVKGGSGKVVFLTAGVHGNELSSQVAAMKLIKYMTENPINGTVYIIPFVNVKAISKKVRFTDKDFNRVAANSGTISNKIVNMVVKLKCDSYGDFHTTKPGGAPGQNIVMGSRSPAKECEALTEYIYKNCNVNKRLYKYAGQEYPGALADNVNKKGIPAVICEVVLPHNTVTTKSVNISLNMMKHLLKFNSII